MEQIQVVNGIKAFQTNVTEALKKSCAAKDAVFPENLLFEYLKNPKVRYKCPEGTTS